MTNAMDEPAYRETAADADSRFIVRALMDAGGDFVSGSRLAAELGVSRPAVHGKLEKLRKGGFEIEAARNRGYRIIGIPTVLRPALLRYELDRLGSSIPVFYYSVLDSTNAEAERRIASGQPSPFVVASSCQTKGRGRLGRVWNSASAENLYLSVLFEPAIPPRQLQHFTLWAGIHICRALQAFVSKASLNIKWPNDLHCDGRKFAGMLTEARMDADRIHSIVFGVGLNVNSNPNNFPAELRSLATSLHAVQGEALPINRIAAATIHAIEGAYAVCIQNSTAETLPAAWAPLNALEGRHVTALIGDREITGVAAGIDASGALLLRQPDGSEEAIHAGDLTLKK